jgi:CubicO group peptidase (beta-lactamase class C family)
MQRQIVIGIVGAIILGGAALLYLRSLQGPETPQLEEYWPTEEWRSAEPADLGLDASRLSSMVDHIRRDIPTIDSVMVVRHGYVAVDEYFGSFTAEQRHRIFSCTKSVTSTLVGIAIDEGLIPGLDAEVLGLLPGYEARNVNEWKTSLTLRHLLPMASGIDARDDYPDNWLWLDRMLGAPDPVQYCLDLNVTVEPGTRFKYTNANSHLMSAIIKEVTGKPALDYAREKLFEPLGIEDVEWESDPQGVNWGHDRLYMRPRDMAKLGLLFLGSGEWDGEQIVPADWVAEATARKMAADLFPGYAYQWWTGDGYYCAMGYAGQFIYVFPDRDMVVVFTGRTMNNFENPRNLIRDYILPAVIR